MRRGVTLDTGALIALERRRASALALVRVCRQARVRITIPAAVIAEWWRGQHRSILEAVTLEPLSAKLAEAAGELLARAGASQAVDAIVVVSAEQRGDIVVTDDPRDLRHLARYVKGVDIAEV